MAWVAERIAEQRLLWNLRKQTTAVAVHPQDMTFEQVMVLIRRMLQRDYERHRLWLVVDTIGLIVSGLLALVPGPNLLAYYFAFRVVGHWLSMRGATQGLVARGVDRPTVSAAHGAARGGAPRTRRARRAYSRRGDALAAAASLDLLRTGGTPARVIFSAGSWQLTAVGAGFSRPTWLFGSR